MSEPVAVGREEVEAVRREYWAMVQTEAERADAAEEGLRAIDANMAALLAAAMEEVKGDTYAMERIARRALAGRNEWRRRRASLTSAEMLLALLAPDVAPEPVPTPGEAEPDWRAAYEQARAEYTGVRRGLLLLMGVLHETRSDPIASVRMPWDAIAPAAAEEIRRLRAPAPSEGERWEKMHALFDEAMDCASREGGGAAERYGIPDEHFHAEHWTRRALELHADRRRSGITPERIEQTVAVIMRAVQRAYDDDEGRAVDDPETLMRTAVEDAIGTLLDARET